MPRKFLITGCARSGTRYISQLITKTGCWCGHERSDREGTACWYCCALLDENVNRQMPVTRCGCQFDGVTIAPDGSVVQPGARKLSDFYEVILHQLRHPLRVIASMQTLTRPSSNYIGNKLDISGYSDKILQATRYWIEWNLRAKELASYSYQIERLETCWPEIAALIELDKADPPFDELPRNINARQHGEVTASQIRILDPLLFAELETTAREFGYTLDS